ncbi:MAG: acyltransferase [Proteobacteria bacterium]|nr:acyltransferase [Pseudomonadota bacterium]
MHNNTLINIQFLRAIAAIAVVLFHTSAHFFAIDGKTTGNVFSFFSSFGYAGVDVFFVISGYIIWISTHKISGLYGVIGYIYNRATRIYLGYWPYFFILLGLAYFYAPEFLKNTDYIGSFFLTQPYFSKLLLTVSWTLRYELYFYLCFALLLLLPRKYTLTILISAFVIIICVQLYAVFIVNMYHPDNFHKATSLYSFYLSPYCLEFLLGCFAGYYFEKHRVKNLLPIVFLAVVSFILALYFQTNYLTENLSSGYFVNQRVLFFGTVSILLLVILIELEKRRVVIMPRLSLLLGGASYSIYLSHTIILYFLYKFGVRDYFKSLESYPVLIMLIVVLFILGYSVLHYLYIEKPLMQLSKNFKRYINEVYS